MEVTTPRATATSATLNLAIRTGLGGILREVWITIKDGKWANREERPCHFIFSLFGSSKVPAHARNTTSNEQTEAAKGSSNEMQC